MWVVFKYAVGQNKVPVLILPAPISNCKSLTERRPVVVWFYLLLKKEK